MSRKKPKEARVSPGSRRGGVVLPPGVLRIKKGYNPNSSSIGTVIYSFPFAFAAVSAVIAAIALIVIKRKKSK